MLSRPQLDFPAGYILTGFSRPTCSAKKSIKRAAARVLSSAPLITNGPSGLWVYASAEEPAKRLDYSICRSASLQSAQAGKVGHANGDRIKDAHLIMLTLPRLALRREAVRKRRK
jgi:hypothetical protein